MICGSSYNYNMSGFMNGTSFLPFNGSSTGFLGGSSIFTQMFGGAMGGCNPFMTSYAQPDFNAMAGWAVADSLLNMGTMLVGAAIQDRKDNSVENTFEDIELLKEEKAKKEDEKSEVVTKLENLEKQTTEITTARDDAASDYTIAKDALDNKKEAFQTALNAPTTEANKKIIEDYKAQQELVEELKQKADDAQKKLDEHKAKVTELEAKKDKLEADIEKLKAQIRAADEKADKQVLDKLLKRKNCSKYSEVGSKFDGNNSLITGKEVSPADAWAVVNAYKNALVDDDQRKIYAEQFKAIYNALSPEDQGDFHGVYRLMRDNHPKIFPLKK